MWESKEPERLEMRSDPTQHSRLLIFTVSDDDDDNYMMMMLMRDVSRYVSYVSMGPVVCELILSFENVSVRV